MRRLLVVAAIASLTAAGAPAMASSSTLYLPPTTGSQPVGSTSIYLKDTSRADPWVPANKRELMVTLWYPATSGHGPKAQYMTPEESELLLSREGLPIPPDILSTVRTNSVRDTRPAGHNLPLIVLSPGYTKPRGTLTALAEDLASHGYAVAAIEHTYESSGTTFPDGRTVSCVSCEVDHLPGFFEKLADGRAADVSFVLDELTRKYGWLIDSRRIAMAGHSAGGGSTIQAMVKDSRLRAGVDLDGRLYIPLPSSGLSRPVMFVGSQTHGPDVPGDPLVRDWPNLTGWKRWLLVAGSQHTSFTDVGILADQLGIDYGADVPGARVAEITRAYVRAFFEQHLQHRPQPLLDRPSTRYPEVKFCSVTTKTCG